MRSSSASSRLFASALDDDNASNSDDGTAGLAHSHRRTESKSTADMMKRLREAARTDTIGGVSSVATAPVPRFSSATADDEEDFALHSALKLEPRSFRLAHSLHSGGEVTASTIAAASSSAAPSVSSSPYRTRVFQATPSGSAAPSLRSSPVRAGASSALAHSLAQIHPVSPSRALGSSAAAADAQLHSTVSALRKQLADQELALSQERSQRLTAQAELSTYQSSPAGLAADAPSISPISPAAVGSAASNPVLSSSSSFFAHMAPQLTAAPDALLWNAHLQAEGHAHQRKIATLSRLLEEQTQAMSELRREKGEVVRYLEEKKRQEEREREQAAMQIHSLTEQLHAYQSREQGQIHSASLLQNELGMVEERARQDISALLARVEQFTHDNAKLRALYVAEKNRADKNQAELSQATTSLAETQRLAESARAAANKYKSKARELVVRVRAAEEQNELLGNQGSAALRRIESLQEACSMAEGRLSSSEKEVTDLHGQIERFREELLGKTRELSTLYQQYAALVSENQRSAEQARLERAHHELIDTLSSPLKSHSMQLDLHKALAAKQSEILDLTALVDSLQKKRGPDAARERIEGLQNEVHALRSKVERLMEEKVRISTENRELQSALQQRSATFSSPRQSSHTTSASSPPPPPHLYQQIVELHEQVATLERRVQDKDGRIDQLSSSNRAQGETIHALEGQIEQLSSHLSSFQSRVLPSADEFAADLAERQRVYDEQYAEAQAREDERAQRAEAQRREQEQRMASRENFVAKAIAIHTEEVSSEVESLQALASCRSLGLQAGIEHLVPKPPIRESTLSPEQTEEKLAKSVSDLRSLRRMVADEYAKGLSQACIMQ